LWELLTRDVLTDRTVRVLPTIEIERIPGGYRIVLKDHASLHKILAEALTLDGLWLALESTIRAPDALWVEFTSYRVKEVAKRKKLE
jgi:hypothetical protein